MSRSGSSESSNGSPFRGIIEISARHGASGSQRAVVVIGRPPALIIWTSTFLLLGFLAVLFVGVWIARYGGGGITWATELDVTMRQQMFNYHPLFMVLGLLYLHGIANLVYRLFPMANMVLLRLIHGTLQLTAVIMAALGVYAAYFSKNMSPTEKFVHFSSTHSWLGLVVLTVMSLQFLGGFFGLLFPGLKGAVRGKYREVHIFSGISIFLLSCTVALTGIDELVIRSSLLNCLALIIVTYALNGAYILTKPEFARGRLETAEADANEYIPILSTREHPYPEE